MSNRFLTDDLDGRRSYARARLERDALNSMRDAVESSGLSNAELANLLGRSTRSVERLLEGKRGASLTAVADVLTVTGHAATLRVTSNGEQLAA